MGDKDKEYYHNKGEKDASEGVYERPHPVGGSFHSHVFGGADEENEENDAYDKGYANTRNQKE